ncbi:ParB/RepB/Spo0J family partition protein [Phenylobacterium sp. VNQ135]|uniref:ParB/RepB/Spo0J family partition protein n=1 Tax=Phenylobacterium sp. VNQ135 TaxID=3400922 RepID=UPI003C01AF32
MPKPRLSATVERLPAAFPLRDLAIAPENLRAEEPPDADIPQLAETILAAGLLQPLTVRPGRRREKPAMVLDGRRRWLALASLLEAGRIGDDYAVSAFVETDPARQAAALVLTNTGVPAHIADVITAIGRMLKAKLTVGAIGSALGYTELDVKRLAALAALHPNALAALKCGRITLRQARLLARLPDRKEQGDLAQDALDGHGLAEWRIAHRLDQGRTTVQDPRFRLIGAQRYAAAGGRTEADLFGERPDVLLDGEALDAAWLARAQALAAELSADGVDVRISPQAEEVDMALEAFGYAYGAGLDAEGLEAWRSAQSAAGEAQARLSDRDLADAACDVEIRAFLTAKLRALVAGEPPRPVTLVQVFASVRTGLDLSAYGPPAVAADEEPEPDEATDEMARPAGTASRPPTAPPPTPVATAPPPEIEGVNHALHEVRTDTATRALIRALADDPGTAVTALAARLFSVLVLRQGLGKGSGALALHAEPYSRPRTSPIAVLDGEVRQRLADRRVAWDASGLSPIAWVAGLAHGERMAMLAELVALSLDLREERTTSARGAARAEAVEIAALCGADVALHWTPDEPFLAAHPKAKLLAMLDDMGAPDSRAGGCRKDELVALVAERAAERGWAPAFLSWAAEPPAEADAGTEAIEAAPGSDAPDVSLDGASAIAA